MEVAVLNIQGKETGRKVTLSDSVFAIEPNQHTIYLDVKQFLANQRQGTHKSKERNEVAGSTKKIKKQKGTGGARAGSVKSPVFVGGGRIFGPRPKDYTQKLNKKVKRLARRSALSLKVQQKELIVVEDFSFDTPKTKDFINILKSLGVENKKSLFVLANTDKNVYLSSRNLPKSKVVTSSELNTYAIVNSTSLILLESSVQAIESVLAN